MKQSKNILCLLRSFGDPSTILRRFMLLVFLAMSTLAVLIISACSHTEKKDIDKLADVWIKYDEPINGYDVSIHCRQAFEGEPNYFSMKLFMKSKHGNIKWSMSELIALERIWKEEYKDKDTITLHNTHAELGSPFLDCYNILYFADMNFDGKDELVVCMFPGGEPNIGDCESFLVFNIHHGWITPCTNNSFIREIGNAVCRAECTVDSINKTITLTEYDTFIGYTEKKFWFKDGFPYRYDYTKVFEEETFQYHMRLYDAELEYAENYQ